MQYGLSLLLLAAHALVVVFASHVPKLLAPVVAASIYGPLWPLSALGVPVFLPAHSGGWSSPTVLGWLILATFWACIWFVVVWLLAWMGRSLG